MTSKAKIAPVPAAIDDELAAQMEALTAEGLQSQKSRLDAVANKKKLIMNNDFLAFSVAYRDVMKAINSEYKNNPRVVDAMSAYQTAGENLDAVKAKECPSAYQLQMRVREIKRAVISLLAKGEVKEALGVKVESVAIGVKLLLNGGVAMNEAAKVAIKATATAA